jgi:hypothetical protein
MCNHLRRLSIGSDIARVFEGVSVQLRVVGRTAIEELRGDAG